MIKWLKNKMHIHCFDKAIASQYRSFHCRNIIYECRCGERREERECREFGDSFPIVTNILITNKEMNQILLNEKTT